ncbi:MAG: triculamin-like lasso peptide [Pseudonocardiaceae bacterium]
MSKKSKPGDGIRGKGVRGGRFAVDLDTTPAVTSIEENLADLATTVDRNTK